jgi:FkbM family methyltransferase
MVEHAARVPQATLEGLPSFEAPRLRSLLRAAWPLTWPVRQYWLHSERKLGKKLVVDHLLKRLLPAPPAGFEAELAGGGKVFLHHREDIGLVVLMSGAFEGAETSCARDLVRPGTVAIDVGANVGMFTVPLALAVGEAGRVLAIEPSPGNVARLTDNLQRNELTNVVVREIAVAEEPGEVVLQLGVDAALHSTTIVCEDRGAGESVVVPAETLDAVWSGAGSPEVSFLKIDTEGGEFAILHGAQHLLRTCAPPILLEAKGDERVRELDEFLTPFGYARTRPRGFAVGNFLYAAA